MLQFADARSLIVVGSLLVLAVGMGSWARAMLRRGRVRRLTRKRIVNLVRP